jgi:hypothetical protein
MTRRVLKDMKASLQPLAHKVSIVAIIVIVVKLELRQSCDDFVRHNRAEMLAWDRGQGSTVMWCKTLEGDSRKSSGESGS